MTRLFVALEIKDDIKNKILSSYSLFPNDVIKAKFIERKNLHITIKFIGEVNVNDINDIIERLNDVKANTIPFNIEYRGMGAFPKPYDPRIIWIGGDSQSLLILANKIDKELHKVGVKKEQRPFSSHITVARVKMTYKKNDVKDIILANKDQTYGKQSVDRFYLKKSELTPSGPIYSNVEVFEL